MTDTVYCTECGAQTSPSARFCSGCGAEQLPTDTTASDTREPREIQATGDRSGPPIVKTSMMAPPETSWPPPPLAMRSSPSSNASEPAIRGHAEQTRGLSPASSEPRSLTPPAPLSMAQHATVGQTPRSKVSGTATGSANPAAITLIAIPFILVGALVSGLWRLAGVLAVFAVIAAFIWGGTTEAHVRCLAHELGAPGLLNSIACVVEH
jgi:hypothetical protein